MKNLISFLLLLAATCSAAADDRADFFRLEDVIRQQVACLDLVEGNVAEGQQGQVTRDMFTALVSNIRAYVALGTGIGIQDLVIVREYVGSDDILVGVFLGAMLSDDAELQREKEELRDGRSLEELHRLLWKRYACDAAFQDI